MILADALKVVPLSETTSEGSPRLEINRFRHLIKLWGERSVTMSI